MKNWSWIRHWQLRPFNETAMPNVSLRALFVCACVCLRACVCVCLRSYVCVCRTLLEPLETLLQLMLRWDPVQRGGGLSAAHQSDLPLPQPVELVEGHPACLCQVWSHLLTRRTTCWERSVWFTSFSQSHKVGLSPYWERSNISLLGKWHTNVPVMYRKYNATLCKKSVT